MVNVTRATVTRSMLFASVFTLMSGMRVMAGGHNRYCRHRKEGPKFLPDQGVAVLPSTGFAHSVTQQREFQQHVLSYNKPTIALLESPHSLSEFIAQFNRTRGASSYADAPFLFPRRPNNPTNPPRLRYSPSALPRLPPGSIAVFDRSEDSIEDLTSNETLPSVAALRRPLANVVPIVILPTDPQEYLNIFGGQRILVEDLWRSMGEPERTEVYKQQFSSLGCRFVPGGPRGHSLEWIKQIVSAGTSDTLFIVIGHVVRSRPLQGEDGAFFSYRDFHFPLPDGTRLTRTHFRSLSRLSWLIGCETALVPGAVNSAGLWTTRPISFVDAQLLLREMYSIYRGQDAFDLRGLIYSIQKPRVLPGTIIVTAELHDENTVLTTHAALA